MAVVKWTEHARDDLREVFDFIARDSPRAAEALFERILRATERLESFPESGRKSPSSLISTTASFSSAVTGSSTVSNPTMSGSLPSSTAAAFSPRVSSLLAYSKLPPFNGEVDSWTSWRHSTL